MNKHLLRLFITSMLAMFTLPVAANISQPTKNKSLTQLKTVRHDINHVENQLQTDRSKLSALQKQLRETEVKISQHEESLRQLNTRLMQTNSLIADIDMRSKAAERQRQQQAAHLTNEVTSQYIMSKQSPVKLLLNQEDPQKVRRMFTYLDYINQARVTDIKRYNQTISSLATLQTQNKQALGQVQQLYATTQKEKNELAKDYSSRTQIMGAIKLSLQNNEEKLVDLKKDEQRLVRLIAKLDAAANANKFKAEPKQAFNNMQGKMPWPTSGKVAKQFGSNQFHSSMRANGIIIAAPLGQQVRAVHGGRVAYANWLRGFGLLIIVDHGDGYMTLYAHNQTLYKEAGDRVKAQDLIATVGKTGGADEPGLYFEVRKHGKPVNPLAWVKKNGGPVAG